MLRESDRKRPIRTSLRYTKWSSFWSAIQEDTGRKQSKIKGKSEFGKHTISMLPFANNCLDYLARTNIDAGRQGRAWGLISFLSQIGYVVAYASAGLLADCAAAAGHTGVGRGAAMVIMISGVLLAAVAAALYKWKDVRILEKQSTGEAYEQTNDNQ